MHICPPVILYFCQDYWIRCDVYSALISHDIESISSQSSDSSSLAAASAEMVPQTLTWETPEIRPQTRGKAESDYGFEERFHLLKCCQMRGSVSGETCGFCDLYIQILQISHHRTMHGINEL